MIYSIIKKQLLDRITSVRQKAELPVRARSVIQMYASIHLSNTCSLDSGAIIQTSNKIASAYS